MNVAVFAVDPVCCVKLEAGLVTSAALQAHPFEVPERLGNTMTPWLAVPPLPTVTANEEEPLAVMLGEDPNPL